MGIFYLAFRPHESASEFLKSGGLEIFSMLSLPYILWIAVFSFIVWYIKSGPSG
jgi:hypothetical protein